MTDPIIERPQGKIIISKGRKAQLVWNANFQPKWQGRYSRAQQFVDSEILRLSEPFTPLRTGMLVKSGTLGTVIGSGTVSWIAPYSRAQYYSPRSPGSETGPSRGPYWFERGKALWGKKLIANARRMAGGGK